MHTLLVSRGGVIRSDLDTGSLAGVLEGPQAIVWLDLSDPGDDEIALLESQFHFHPLAIEDAARSHERPKVDAYDAYYFVVFYAAYYDPAHDHVDTQSIGLFISTNYLVTVHRRPLPEIGEVMDRWRLPRSPLNGRTSVLVHALLDALVDDYFPLMDQVADRVESLEDEIFVHFDESAIHSVFALKRDLLSLRRVVAPERDVLNVLLRRQLPVFQPEDMVYMQDVYDHIVRVTDSIDTYRDLVSSALDSYLSLQSNRLNQIMKLLTMASIVLMTDALIAGIYGMNFRFMPELNWLFGYGWALLLMVLSTVGLVIYFQRRRWF
jgi:magnesium transporter